MPISKRIKDQLIRILNGNESVPRGLFEMSNYFRLYGPISFERHLEEGRIIVVSNNFKQGSIVTFGDNEEQLDKNIKDAILTTFEIPSSYSEEAKIHKVSDKTEEYALA
ncbi:MAG: hypothetical protein AAB358_01335 [Patescibacteria group bacterium]